MRYELKYEELENLDETTRSLRERCEMRGSSLKRWGEGGFISVCVCVCVFWGEGRGVNTKIAQNILKHISALELLESDELSKIVILLFYYVHNQQPTDWMDGHHSIKICLLVLTPSPSLSIFGLHRNLLLCLHLHHDGQSNELNGCGTHSSHHPLTNVKL